MLLSTNALLKSKIKQLSAHKNQRDTKFKRVLINFTIIFTLNTLEIVSNNINDRLLCYKYTNIKIT